MQHVTDPFDALKKNPSDRKSEIILLDHYGQFPFTSLPRNYNSAVSKFTKHILESFGVLPWEVGVYSARLTDAFKSHNWEDARAVAAQLAFYVAAAHDPFNTTTNEDGKLSNQARGKPAIRIQPGGPLPAFLLRPSERGYLCQ